MNWLKLHHKRILLVVGLGTGLIQSIRYSWISDDAYISYIYARNLWEGNGLVFQIGERVEGYTNFLWTVLHSLSFPLGYRIEDFSIALSIVIYFFLLLSIRNPYLIFSYSLFYFGWEFATGGLETGLFALGITLGYGYMKDKKWGESIFISSILPLVRPEGAMFALANFFLMSKKISDWKDKKNIIFLILSLVVFLIFLGKVIYYGDIFPNTYYAKASSGDYLSQGFLYLFYFYKEFIVMSIFLMVGLIFSRESYSWVVIVYILYVAYVGGDFMFSRFLIPILPISLILTWNKLIETRHAWIEKFGVKGKQIADVVFIIFILSPLMQSGAFTKNSEEIYLETGIAHERKIYTNLGSNQLNYDTEVFKNVSVSFWGAQSHFIYYMRPKLAIESTTGLTDPILAKRPIEKRGAIGHEKKADLDYLKQRGVEIVMSNVYPELDDPGRNLYYNWNGNRLLWKVLYLDENNLKILENHPNFDTSHLNSKLWD